MKLIDFYNSPLQYSKINNTDAILTKDLSVILHCKEQDIILRISEGFIWNGNSGSFPCRFSKDNERYNVSILCHDVFYHDIGISKSDADDILRGCLRESGYNRFMAGLIHKAVQIFGNKSFGNIEHKSNIDKIKMTMLKSGNAIL